MRSFNKLVASGVALTTFGLAGCALKQPDALPSSPASRSSTWLGSCGIAWLHLQNEAKGDYAQACTVATNIQTSIETGQPVKLAHGNGWFTDADRSACVALPVVSEINGQGYFAHVKPNQEGKPVVTLYDLPGALPHGQTESVVLRPEGDHYVADVSRAAGGTAVQAVAQQLQPGSCK